MSYKKVILTRVEQEIKNYKESILEIKDLQSKMKLTRIQQLRLVELKRITEAIDDTYTILGEKQKHLVRIKYWSHILLTWDGIASRLNIGRSTAFRWRDEIIVEITERLGWWK